MRALLHRIYRNLFRCKCVPITHEHNEREGVLSNWHSEDELGGGDA